jgi:hypothetical protein
VIVIEDSPFAAERVAHEVDEHLVSVLEKSHAFELSLSELLREIHHESMVLLVVEADTFNRLLHLVDRPSLLIFQVEVGAVLVQGVTVHSFNNSLSGVLHSSVELLVWFTD